MGYLVSIIWVGAYFGMIVPQLLEQNAESTQRVVMIPVMLIMLVVAVAPAIIQFKTRKARKAKRDAKRAAAQATYKEEMGKKLASKDIVGTAKHVTGLPLAENALCNLSYTDDKIVISQGVNTFNLDLAKITDMRIATESEIQKHMVSSIGGAVAGAALFGTVGAMVGGRAKTKETRTITQFLVITYTSNDEIKYISFVHPSRHLYSFVKRFNFTEDRIDNVVEL